MLCESQNLAGMELRFDDCIQCTVLRTQWRNSEVELSINVESLPQDPIAYEIYKILATETWKICSTQNARLREYSYFNIAGCRLEFNYMHGTLLSQLVVH